MKYSERFDANWVGLKLAIAAICGLVTMTQAYAESFDGVEPGMTPGLKLEPARRYFVKFGYTYIKPTDKPAAIKDVTGPVLSFDELKKLCSSTPNIAAGSASTCNGSLYTKGTAAGSFLDKTGVNAGPGLTGNAQTDTPRAVLTQLYAGMRDDLYLKYGLTGASKNVSNIPAGEGLGTPVGTAQVASGAGTPTISAGMFLDEDMHWALEAYVFALPFTNKIYGAGRIGGASGYPTSPTGPTADGPEGGGSVQLGVIATTQQLPLTAIGSYYFGDKSSKLRPWIGLGVTYAMFFNTQATKSEEDYAGGATSIKINNAFGAGPFAGLQYDLGDRWSLNATVGYMKLKTQAFVTTNVNPSRMAITPATYQAAADIGMASGAATPGDSSTYQGVGLGDTAVSTPDGQAMYGANSTVAQAMLIRLAKARAAVNGGDPNSLGTYVRKVDAVLDPYVFTVSVGYSF